MLLDEELNEFNHFLTAVTVVVCRAGVVLPAIGAHARVAVRSGVGARAARR